MEVSDIVEAIDIEEYLSQYCDFEEKGGELWSLSPFKDEQTPSFSLNTEKGFWYDFSAGFGGNLIDFVMKHDGVGLSTAVNKLKQYSGIQDDGQEVSKRLQATKVAKKYGRAQKQKPYMGRNKPLPDGCMDMYRFDTEKLKPWYDEGISWEAMERFGVRFDDFGNRIVYPVKSYDGKIISVCGRTMDPDFKEKHIRKYTYYGSLGGQIDTLCCYSDNEDDILQQREIIIFEGAKSCMKTWGWGIRNTAALLTSHVSTPQLIALIKLSSNFGVRCVFALDSDINIMEDTNIQKLRSYANVEWVRNRNNMLDEKDSPADKGETVFKTLYERREIL